MRKHRGGSADIHYQNKMRSLQGRGGRSEKKLRLNERAGAGGPGTGKKRGMGKAFQGRTKAEYKDGSDQFAEGGNQKKGRKSRG